MAQSTGSAKAIHLDVTSPGSIATARATCRIYSRSMDTDAQEYLMILNSRERPSTKTNLCSIIIRWLVSRLVR
jgi:hypothetical protein